MLGATAASGDDKFLDFALRRRDQLMVVECKRSRDTEWIFLREPINGIPNNDRRVNRAWVTIRKPDEKPSVNGWLDILTDPSSARAQYCVIRKNNQRTQELLERTAAEVVRAVEAIARQDLDISRTNNSRLSSFYIPVIVTTARLFLCDVDLNTFDEADGAIPNSDFNEVKMVRFVKSLNHPATYGDALSLEDVSKQAERSVLIVQSEYFVDFLRQCEWDFRDDQALLAKNFFGS